MVDQIILFKALSVMRIWKNNTYNHAMMQLIAYGLVGIANTILTVFLYWLFLEVFEWHYILSFTLSWLLGVIFTYIINANRVFHTEESNFNWLNFLKYTIVYVFSYMLNTGVLWLLVSCFGYDAFWMQCIIIPFVVLINFVGIKFWALR